jgi:stearoyl-CoA desaturase (Delta-9 desaturase)
MESLLIATLVFLAGYLLNIFYITVLYHRGLTHKALVLHPGLVKWIAWTGNWVTGLDPKAWICMHRLHHLHADTAADPHSPLHQGVFGLAIGQLKSYEQVLRGLMRRKEPYTSLVKDLPFDVSFLNKRRLWALPYFLHLALALVLGIALQNPLVGFAYLFGIMSHPIQGWMVNSLAHRYGYRNFVTDDNSRNNRMVALMVFGEGYQNNHHAYPQSARFSMKPGEIDLGYLLCRGLMVFQLAKIPK